jgi:hypothetical protein
LRMSTRTTGGPAGCGGGAAALFPHPDGHASVRTAMHPAAARRRRVDRMPASLPYVMSNE